MGQDTATQPSPILNAQKPSKQIPLTSIISKNTLCTTVTRTHTRKRDPALYTAVRNCIKYIIHGQQRTNGMRVPLQVMEHGGVTHAYFSVCIKSVCRSMCPQDSKNPFPLLSSILVAFLNQGPPSQMGRVIYCSVNDTRLTGLPLHIEALWIVRAAGLSHNN